MFDIRAQQPSLFPIELANDNVDPKRRAAGAPDFERLREIFHDGGIEGFAAAALLTDQRDRLTEIRIDGMLSALLHFPHSCHSSATVPIAYAGRACTQLSR